METRTAVVLGGLVVLLGALAVFAVEVPSGAGFTEAWVSDTPRDNDVNHHAVGAGPAGQVVVAPVAESSSSEAAMTDRSCALVGLAPANGSVLWQAGVPAEDCFTHALTEPAIADIDGDGAMEAVVATTENALVVRDAATGAEEWRLPLTTYGYGRPTVADLVGGPAPEVVVSDIDGGVTVAHGDGSVAWRATLESTVLERPFVWEAPTVADVDADGDPEVFLGSHDGPAVLSADGAVEWVRNGSATHTATAQIDDDSALELVTAGSSVVRAYDGASGALQWERDVPGARLRAAGDADGDGTPELYVGRTDGRVVALDATTGETEWSTAVAGEDVMTPPPVLGDLDGDGDQELVAVGNDGSVVALAPDSGAELAAYERSVPIWTFATVADTDGDGDGEVLVRYGDGRVVALDYG
jgi:outer membrane protein assembly factor BamB